MPPVSKVMPLPTSTTCGRAPAGRQASSTSRGPLAEPPPTARMPPKPSAASSAGLADPQPQVRTVGRGGGHLVGEPLRGLHRGRGCWSGPGRDRVIRGRGPGRRRRRPRTAAGSATQQVDARRSAGPVAGLGRVGTGTRPASSPSARPRTAAGGHVGRQRDRDMRLSSRRRGPGPRRPPASPPRRRRRRRAAAAGRASAPGRSWVWTSPAGRVSRAARRSAAASSARAVRAAPRRSTGARPRRHRPAVDRRDGRAGRGRRAGRARRPDGWRARGTVPPGKCRGRRRTHLPAALKTLSHRRCRWLRV